MTGLSHLLDEATEALARLDGEALGMLEVDALRLDVHAAGASADEVMARFRVFAGVLRETERGLTVLGRVQAVAGGKGGDAWVR